MATAALLEKKGVSMDEKDNEGKTALDIADLNGQEEILNYIKGKTYFRHTNVRTCIRVYVHFYISNV
jgi:hypothetical protein